MRPWSAVAAGVLALCALALALVLALGPRGRDAHGHVEGGGPRLEPLFPAPTFALENQAGQEVSTRSLEGRVWVASFIFTSCRTVCPLLTAKLGQLQRRLEGVDVRFVSFSVDPARDTPEVLLAYAQRWRPHEARWSLLATTAETLPQLAKGFHVLAQPVDGGVDPILHSNVFLLVDGQGQVRGAYDSERPEQFAQLEADVRTLARSSAEAPPLAQTGEALYHQLGCVGCHERPELAPPLRGLAGTRRPLENGLTAVADEAYVKEAILVPQARRVAGYPLVMPTYAGLLDGDALGRLAAWVLARPADGAAPEEPAAVELDPVCGMKVRASRDALRLERAGKTTWFCSEYCRDQWAGRPEPPSAP